MNFKVVDSRVETLRSSENKNTAFLLVDRWDDWFTYNTLYILIYIDNDAITHEIGGVKIGQYQHGTGRPKLKTNFPRLESDYFSLGQDDSYYEKLNSLGSALRDEILDSLNDIAKKPSVFEKAIKEDVTRSSLMRFVSETTIRGQFRRLANGGVRLSDYHFTYVYPIDGGRELSLSFNVEPESNPPTNIHVLIGRNGVGKTFLMKNMIRVLTGRSVPATHGQFRIQQTEEVSTSRKGKGGFFSNIVSVSFSAFDQFEGVPAEQEGTSKLKYEYVGLKKVTADEDDNQAPKSRQELTEEFVQSLLACMIGAKKERWVRAIEMLSGDPIFKEANIRELIGESETNSELKRNAANLFKKKLSSGHMIVLLTLTRLVESVAEKTLVLLDEPEGHLHPPLLSAFIRALSDLLIDRNGVAIIATHSPVILQEVPNRCVWKLRRIGKITHADRLEIESFGENVGTLTREIFGLEVTHSGFHKLLQDAVLASADYEDVLRKFNSELGMEAKALANAMLLDKSQSENN